MRNLLAFIGAAILTFLGLGWYLGWYNIVRQPSDTGHSRLEVDINQDKISKDVQKGAQEGGNKVKEVFDKNAPADSTLPAQTSPATPNKNGPTPFYPPNNQPNQPQAKPSNRAKLGEAVKDTILDELFPPKEDK
jgi:hypothetical protein